jgi:hypothetical protein
MGCDAERSGGIHYRGRVDWWLLAVDRVVAPAGGQRYVARAWWMMLCIWVGSSLWWE